MATSLSCRVSAISAFCWPTTQTPSITDCIDAIVHTKPVIAILVSKLVAVATTLRHTISDISSSDSLTPTTHPWNQTVCRWLSYNQNYSPSKAKNWLPWQRPLASMDPRPNTWFPGPVWAHKQMPSRSVQPSSQGSLVWPSEFVVPKRCIDHTV